VISYTLSDHLKPSLCKAARDSTSEKFISEKSSTLYTLQKNIYWIGVKCIVAFKMA
jgi:hypothetical protein